MTNIERILWGIQQRLLGTVAQAMTYPWSDQFKLQELASAFSPEASSGRHAVTMLTIADLQTLTRDTLYRYGFGKFDDALVLIPLYVVPFIRPEEEVTDIFGEKLPLSQMDKDVRYGCIAAGFKL